MSEADPAPPSARAHETLPASVEPTGFGARLAWHREKAGLTVGDIAGRLRLSANHVRAIEAENLSALPALAYVRGFVRGYARIVDVDPAPLLAQLTPRTGTGEVATTHSDDRGSLPGPTDGRMTRRIVVATAVLVLIALGAIGWQTTSRPPVRSAVAETPVPIAKPAAPVVEASAPAADGPAAPTASAAVELAPNMASAAGTDSDAAAGPAPEVAEAAPPSTANLSIAFDGECWVEVTAANGRVVYSQLHPAGSQAEINAPLPLTVVLGDGARARVAVRGKPFDIAPHLRQNVARFTVDR